MSNHINNSNMTNTPMARGAISRFLPVLTLGILVLAGVAFVYSNAIFHLTGRTTHYESHAEVGGYQVSLSAERQFEMPDKSVHRLRDIRISFPLAPEIRGCELRYAAAVSDFEGTNRLFAGQGQLVYIHPRYLLKFKYDLKNKRCESKDLFVLSGDVPNKISVQFVRVDLTANELIETPFREGLQIEFERAPQAAPVMRVKATAIEPAPPFIADTTTVRSASFSVAKVSAPNLLIHPYDSLNKYILEELQDRIALCKAAKVCDRILFAVAKITDRKLLNALEEAREVGLPVEMISNYRYRLDQEADDLDSEGEDFNYSPWFWLRGSIYAKGAAGKLPMHAKFVVFGDDLVVSSNPSLRAGLRHRSREYSLVYRDKAVVGIFKEIFALVRTSLYYPLKVNLKDELVILLNANRPRQYAVSAEKPFVAIDTQEGIRSNAYGLLYELLDSNPGKLTLAMSPLSNSCAAYRKERCLFDLLQSRAQSAELDLILNGFYYIPPGDRLGMSSLTNTFWTPERFGDSLGRSASHKLLTDLFPSGSEGPRAFIEATLPMSTHHERAALLGKDIAILGSANWGNISTLNTIEVLRSEALVGAIKQEISTFEEPWFVSAREDMRESRSRYGNCEFSFEIQTRVKAYPAPFEITKEEITAELHASRPDVKISNLILIEPKLDMLWQLDKKIGFESRPITDKLQTPSSYLCLENRVTKETHVIRVIRPPSNE